MAAQIVRDTFVCPTRCGCAVALEATVQTEPVSVDALPTDTIADYKARVAAANDTSWRAVKIITQCAGHAHLIAAATLYAEIVNYHGYTIRPSVCACAIPVVRDDRVPDAPFTVVEGAPGRQRCHAHKLCPTLADQYAEVITEDTKVRTAIADVIAALALPDDATVPWSLDASRNVVIDHAALGVTAEEIAAAIKG